MVAVPVNGPIAILGTRTVDAEIAATLVTPMGGGVPVAARSRAHDRAGEAVRSGPTIGRVIAWSVE